MRRRLVNEQAGLAVPVAVMVLFICLLLVSASALRAQATLDHANRDRWERQAQHAAEAGLRTAIYRANAGSFDLGVVLDPNIAQQCLVSVGGQLAGAPIGGTLLGGRRWCGAVEGDLGNGATYLYRVSNTVSVNGATSLDRLLDRRVVATGTAGPAGRGVHRRVGVEIRAQATREKTSTKDLASLKLFSIAPDSFRACRGPVPAAGADPWTGCGP